MSQGEVAIAHISVGNNSMKQVTAPFPIESVYRLNQRQVGVDSLVSTSHPLTCRNRGDGAHGNEGGDRGVLVATPHGWYCPYCGYSQDWAPAAMAQPHSLSLPGHLGLSDDEARTRLLAVVGSRLEAYKALHVLSQSNSRMPAEADDAIRRMIESLNVRGLALRDIVVNPQTREVVPDARRWIPLKLRQPPMPGEYEALYLDAHVASLAHPGFGAGAWVARDQWGEWSGTTSFAGTQSNGYLAAYWREVPEQDADFFHTGARADAMPTVHLHAQAYWHDPAYVTGNRAGLLALRQAIDEALGEAEDSSVNAFTSDGEGYDLRVRRVDGAQIHKLGLPYTDEVARDRDPQAVWPWTENPDQ